MLTVEAVALAFAFAAAGIVAALWWLWQSDRLPHAATAQIADGVRVPVGATGAATPIWWAMVILLIVDGTVFASMMFAHVHVSMRLVVCPPPGAALPSPVWPLLAAGLLAAGSMAIGVARKLMLRRVALVALVLVAMACVAGAFAAIAYGHAGLQP